MIDYIEVGRRGARTITDKRQRMWSLVLSSLFGSPAARKMSNRKRYHHYGTEARNQANHRRKVAERNQAHRRMAAASRRRNRG